MKHEQTGLEEFKFGNLSEDIFYILVDKRISPDGIDIQKLTGSDPRNFDAALKASGCIIMLNLDEINELSKRGEIDTESLHESLFGLAKREGLL